MKRKLITAILMLLTTTLWAADNFVSFKKSTGMIPLTGSSDTIVYDKAEWKGVIMAINNLRQDLKAVTGSDKANIIVATVGKSPIAKKYEKYAKMLKGKWEQYIIVAPHPLEGGFPIQYPMRSLQPPTGGQGGRALLLLSSAPTSAALSMAYTNCLANWACRHGIGGLTFRLRITMRCMSSRGYIPMGSRR